MAQVSQIKAVGFDLGGVVLATEQDKFYGYCQTAFGVSKDKIYQALNQHQPSLERGDIKIEEFWQKVTQELGVQYNHNRDIDLWTKHYIGDSPINQGLLDLSDQLRREGYRTGLLSNTHEEHIRLNEDRGIFEHFDITLLSSRMGTRKPETEAFQALWQGLEVDQRQLAFIDDNLENIAAAISLGIHAIKYTNNKEVIEELKTLDIPVG